MKDKINKICTELNDGKIAVVQATEQLFDLYSVTPRFSVSLVYQNPTANMLRTLVTDANSKEEALGKAIQYFNKETDGFGLILK